MSIQAKKHIAPTEVSKNRIGRAEDNAGPSTTAHPHDTKIIEIIAIRVAHLYSISICVCDLNHIERVETEVGIAVAIAGQAHANGICGGSIRLANRNVV